MNSRRSIIAIILFLIYGTVINFKGWDIWGVISTLIFMIIAVVMCAIYLIERE